MQFGIFTIGDVTTDPTTGRTPTENERIRNTVEIALKAEEIGLDVFATFLTVAHAESRGHAPAHAHAGSPETERSG